jgi:putative nucleotidyltransferase with HDIG domain
VDLRSHLIERIDAGALELPVLPTIAHEAMSAISGDQQDARSLAQLIQRDQAITGHVLRIANSPAYCTRTQIASLRQAIVVLGMRSIGQIVFLISCKSRMFKVGGFEAELKQLFQHAFATGLFAQEIARVRKLNIEEAFVSGLLHDIGRAVILQEVADCLRRFPNHGTIDVPSLLDERHAELSGKMTTTWQLPPRIVEAIRYHHHPENAPFYAPNAYLVQLADSFAHTLNSGEYEFEAADDALATHPAVEQLHLTADDLATILKARAKIRDAVGVAT